ncbi:MAG: Gfo/Idh/MocA family oxidoreductase [Actinomycetota bacterium]|nr:Gfo/Idh/MocA family oxidoreductase [Actinomycetota bacterium]
MPERTRVGVVGCGLIAQVMHLPYLTELSDRFEVTALCDLAQPVGEACARRYGVARVHTSWPDLLSEDIDAAMVLTSGDHAPIAIAAAQAGLHVFTEKPMALSSRAGASMLEAAQRSGVVLMVGTMKRYDPAYERLVELIGDLRDLRLVRVTTLESPLAPYVAHLRLIPTQPPPADVLEALKSADERVVDEALGDADSETRSHYRWILLDNLVHELNALRGLLGEPTEIRHAELSSQCVAINLRFGEVDCHLSWVDLPGIARYKQEFALLAPDRRLTLRLPSPFLASMPSRLIIEGGDPGTAHSWEREEIVSYEEAFKRELVEFSDCIASGREPRTSGADGLADVRLCEAIARVHMGKAARLGEDVGVPAVAAGSLGAARPA